MRDWIEHIPNDFSFCTADKLSKLFSCFIIFVSLFNKTIVKSLSDKKFRLLSFYKYVTLSSPEKYVAEHLEFCKQLGIRGKVYFADEGINGNISAPEEKATQYKSFLTSHKEFSDIWFKEDTTDDFVYPSMYVRLKKELVHLGAKSADLAYGGIRLKPSELLQFYNEQKDFVIIDTRNTYESVIGHFKNAITPKMNNFREWESVAESLSEYKDKPVVTYCTGGIRCEKASAILRQKGFKEVYQLDGGIITFVKQFPDTVWEGGVFVFDDRKVLEPNSKEELKYTSVCHHCGKPTSYYINCHNLSCDKIFVCCHTCKEEHNYCCSEECKTADKKRKKIYP